MIDYVEVRDENLDLLGIIDAFNSVIWNSVYYGVGDFEIYTRATEEAIQLLHGRSLTAGYFLQRSLAESSERSLIRKAA